MRQQEFKLVFLGMLRFTFFLCALALISCSKPIAEFSFNADKPEAPSIVQFANSSEKAEFYEWDFGDGDSSVEKDPSHKYYRSGEYIVTLKAIKENKITELKKTVLVEKPSVTMVEIQTEYGTMIAELYDATPQHRDNFMKLAAEGFFNDLLFHRVMDGFMIQGGDPNSRDAAAGARLGAGGPGYTVPAEFDSELIHVKGALAAARQGDAVNPQKASSGSQFYIVQGNPLTENELELFEARTGNSYSSEQKESYMKNGGTPFLDNEYTVFGQVIQGLEVIDEIAKTRTDASDRPVEDIKMTIKLID